MVAVASDGSEHGAAQSTEMRAARSRRKVSDDILHAFHFACDMKDLEIAQALLKTLENLLVKRVATPAAQRTRELAPLVAAHERLWALRQNADH